MQSLTPHHTFFSKGYYRLYALDSASPSSMRTLGEAHVVEPSDPFGNEVHLTFVLEEDVHLPIEPGIGERIVFEGIEGPTLDGEPRQVVQTYSSWSIGDELDDPHAVAQEIDVGPFEIREGIEGRVLGHCLVVGSGASRTISYAMRTQWWPLMAEVGTRVSYVGTKEYENMKQFKGHSDYVRSESIENLMQPIRVTYTCGIVRANLHWFSETFATS